MSKVFLSNFSTPLMLRNTLRWAPFMPLMKFSLVGLLFSQNCFAADWITFIEQKKVVPAGLEWGREIVARAAGTFRCQIESQPPFAVTLVTDKAYRASKANDFRGINRGDVLLAADLKVTEFDREIQIPTGGSYWFIIENQTLATVEMTLRCAAEKRK